MKEDKYFSFTVQGQNKLAIEVARTKKEREQFITLRSSIVIDTAHRTKLNSLSERHRQIVLHEILLELSRQKIVSRIDYPRIIIETRVLIDELTQAKLIDQIDDVDYALTLIILKIRLLLEYDERLNKPKEEGPPQPR